MTILSFFLRDNTSMVRSFVLLPGFPILYSPAKSSGWVCKNTPPSFYDTLELGEVKQIFNDQVSFLPVFSVGWHETSGVPLPHVFVPVCVCLICATTESPNFLHGKRLSKIELCRHAFAHPFVEQHW